MQTRRRSGAGSASWRGRCWSAFRQGVYRELLADEVAKAVRIDRERLASALSAGRDDASATCTFHQPAGPAGPAMRRYRQPQHRAAGDLPCWSTTRRLPTRSATRQALPESSVRGSLYWSNCSTDLQESPCSEHRRLCLNAGAAAPMLSLSPSSPHGMHPVDAAGAAQELVDALAQLRPGSAASAPQQAAAEASAKVRV